MMFNDPHTIQTAIAVRCTIAFSDIRSEIPVPFGSGTLIRSKLGGGILTCGHVWERVKTFDHVGIHVFGVQSRSIQRFVLPVFELREAVTSFYNGPGANGPDLALIPLPPNLFSDLKAKASYVDLDLHGERMHDNTKQSSTMEFVSGFIDEWTEPGGFTGQHVEYNIVGLMCNGRIVEHRNVEGWDILDFQPEDEDPYRPPKSYGGMSGGGLWRIHVLEDGTGQVANDQARLIGVVFWQTDDNPRKFVGHGPNSVYRLLLDQVYGLSGV